MTRLFLDPAGHADMIANLTAATHSIQAELDHLDDAVAALRSRWSGSAQLAYDEAHEQWSKVMSGLRDQLRVLSVNARTAGERLVQADRDALAIWT